MKIPREDRAEILRRHEAGESTADLAREYNVSKRRIRQVYAEVRDPEGYAQYLERQRVKAREEWRRQREERHSPAELEALDRANPPEPPPPTNAEQRVQIAATRRSAAREGSREWHEADIEVQRWSRAVELAEERERFRAMAEGRDSQTVIINGRVHNVSTLPGGSGYPW